MQRSLQDDYIVLKNRSSPSVQQYQNAGQVDDSQHNPPIEHHVGDEAHNDGAQRIETAHNRAGRGTRFRTDQLQT